jgi:hypothetical protein
MTDQAVADMGQANHGNRGLEPAGTSGGGRRSNWRTALVLLTIALAFFVGVIVNRYLFS